MFLNCWSGLVPRKPDSAETAVCSHTSKLNYLRLHYYPNVQSFPQGGEWSSLSPQQRREKEIFLAGEQRASKGFMTQATLQLELLHNMTEVEVVAKCLCIPPLAKRTAAAVSSLGRELVLDDSQYSDAVDPARHYVWLSWAYSSHPVLYMMTCQNHNNL